MEADASGGRPEPERGELAGHEPAKPRWKPILLPAEHGGWGFLFEPLLLGALVAPSGAGAALALAATGAFLVRHPLKLVVSDVQRGRWHPRTTVAASAVAIWVAMAGLSLALSVALAGTAHLWPLVAGFPLACLQLAYDLRGRGRELAPEIAGAVALAVTAPALVVADGRAPALATFVWIILSLRAATAIVYVRCRLRLARGVATSRVPPVVVHIGSLLVLTGLAILGLSPWLAVFAFGVLLGRALHGLSPSRPPVKPRRVGFEELAFGLITTAFVALGVRLAL